MDENKEVLIYRILQGAQDVEYILSDKYMK
jgi:hypothetical protein